MNDNDVLVTVLCLTYNHEKYIKQCLDGFIEQKTNFKYEVLVHDDASTDNTANIIRQYEQKYPQIIRPYYQKENVYSKHIPITKTFLAPMIKGKYIAFCEGDDYWSDKNKLQKQFDILEEHQDCQCCVHRVKIINEDGTNTGKSYPGIEMNNKTLLPSELVERILSNNRFHTTSYFVNAYYYLAYICNPPQFLKVSPVGDTPLILYFATIGNAYYLNDCMSCYRRNSIGCWTKRTWSSKESLIEYREKMIHILNEYDIYSNKKFSDLINNTVKGLKFELNMLKGDYLSCCSDDYTYEFKKNSFRCRTSIRIHACLQYFKCIFKR